MYVTALTNRLPARNTACFSNGTLDDGLVQEIAVVSRDAERTRLSVGEQTARTWTTSAYLEWQKEIVARTSDVCAARVVESL